MRLVASPEAAEFIRRRGGRLYVWPDSHRCCHGTLTLLQAATEPPKGLEFTPSGDDELVVLLPSRLHRRPEELHLELRRWPRRRVAAYWDGCAYVD